MILYSILIMKKGFYYNNFIDITSWRLSTLLAHAKMLYLLRY